MGTGRSPGWYRWYWDGSAWRLGEEAPSADHAADTLAPATAEIERFLNDARDAHLLTPAASAELHAYLAHWEHACPARPTVVAAASSAPAPQRSAPSRPAVPAQPVLRPVARPPLPAPRPAPVAPAPRPAPVRRSVPLPPPAARHPSWLERARRAVQSDLTLHGLAYLGVLLLFAGVFGLVVFAYGDVSLGLRPVAEVAVPTALFTAAWVLHRRGAHVVADALMVAGGAVTPIVALAMFTDDAVVPPDVDDEALVIAATATSALVAAAYAAVARRHPSSPLRYLVAPVAWLAVAMACLAVRVPGLSGKAIAHASAGQVAVVTVAVAVTALLARARPQHVLSLPSTIDVLVALPVLGLLALLSGARDGWWLLPVTVTALAAVVALEGASRLLPHDVVGLLQPMALAVPLLVPGSREAVGVTAAGLTLAFLALTEWQGRQRPADVPVHAAAGGTVLALTVSFAAPWAAVASSSAASVWAGVRRVRPLTPLPAPALEVAAALLPGAVAFALHQATDPELATIAVALAVLVMAIAVRAAGQAADVFWRWWLTAAGALAAGAATVVSALTAPSLGLAGGAIAAAGAIALVATPAAVRVWSTSAALVAAAAIAAAALDLPLATQAVVLAVAAAILTTGGWWHTPVGPHLALVGHVAGTSAVLLAAGPGHWSVDVALALAVAGWASASVAARVGRWSVTALAAPFFEGIGVAPDTVPLAVTLAGLPALGLLAAHGTGLLETTITPAALVLAAAGLAYTLGGRVSRATGGSGRLLTDAGLLAATAAVPFAIGDRAALLTAALVVVAVPLLEPRDLRRSGATWLGWVATGVAGLAATSLLGTPDDRLGLPLAGWGGALLLGAIAADVALDGPRPDPGWMRRDTTAAPATVGSTGAVSGFAVTLLLPDPAWAWYCLAAAGVLAAVALFSRVGLVSVAAWASLLAGLAGVAPFDPFDRPWTFVAAAAVPVVAAAVLERTTPHARWWERWDLPALAAGHAAAIVGIVVAPAAAAVAVTWASAGALSLAVAAWRRHPAWAAAGALLVVGAGADAGPAWRTTALAGVAAATLAVSTRLSGLQRPLVRATGIGLTGLTWLSLTDWLDWTAGQLAIATAVSAGALLAVTGIAARWAGIDRTTAGSWAVLGAAGLGAAAALLPAVEPLGPGLAVAAGLALAAAGSALAAAPLEVGVLRHAASLLLLAAGAVCLWAIEAAPVAATLAALAAALTVVLATALLARWRPQSVWVAPLDVATAGCTAGALTAAASAPDPGPLALTLATMAGGSTFAGLLRRLTVLQLVPPVTATLAWVAFTGWQGWSEHRVVIVSAILAGTVVVLSGVLLRWSPADRRATAVWGVVGLAGLATAATQLTAADRLELGTAVATGSLLAAVGAALAARPLDVPVLRDLAALLMLAAGGTLWWATAASPEQVTTAACIAAFSAMLTGLVLAGRDPASPWLGALDATTVAFALTALFAGALAWPDREPLVGALAAIGGLTAAAGTVRNQPALLLSTPVALAGAWLLWATEALRGQATWMLAPVGLALLVEAGLLRRLAEAEGLSADALDSTTVVAVEGAGVALLVGPAFVELFTRSVAYGVIALLVGVALAGWGILTRVRRRLATGAGVTVLAVVLMVVVPLAEAMPAAGGAALWIGIAIAGIVAIGLATLLESGRARLGRAVEQLRSLTSDWR